jgi:hypothetical protein
LLAVLPQTCSCDLECCSISYSVDIDLKFDFEEHASSESELSEFSFEDINEIDKLVVVHGNVSHVFQAINLFCRLLASVHQ